MDMQRTVTTLPSEEKLTLIYVLNQLRHDDLITEKQQTQLSSKIRNTNNELAHPLIVIAEQGWKSAAEPSAELTLEHLTEWLAEKTGFTYFKVDPLKIDVNKVTSVVSQAYATNLKILPVKVTKKELTVATCEPFLFAWEHELSRIVNLKIKRVIINPNDIERYLIEFYGISRSILGAVIDKSNETISKLQNFEQLIEVGKMGEPDANDQHIVSIVDWLLQFAFEQRASDIHLEPRRDKGKIRFRIDSMLHNVHEFPIVLMGAIASRLKIMGRMDITDKRRPQDGRIKTKTPSGKEVEMRLSTMPTAFGEKLVIRIFDPEMLFKSFIELGFTQHDQQAWAKITDNSNGIILVTGPTGSGKTTTLYSSLKHLSRPEFNICTIEDPIEMVDPLFNQMQVQPQIGVDFASGVRTLLRQDPDIIMVGEIRDIETADVAIQAALTGHLVLASLHTNDAPSAITRLIDIGIQPFLIDATIRGILAQRLIRTLCIHCKQAAPIDKSAWNKLVAPAKVRLPANTFAAVGCDACRNTGYLGRIGIYETLVLDRSIHKLIAEQADIEAIRAAAIKQGMRTLRISGAQKIAEGLTTIEEIYSVMMVDDASK
jgi:general secretion pathway protein E